jgi:hypothetical protein
MESNRRRNRSFHEGDESGEMGKDLIEDNEVRFITPMYGGDITEPLDLSKLCLDDDLFDKDEGDEDGNNNEDEAFTRGRSRSRSVHVNDDIGPESLTVGLIPPKAGGGGEGGVDNIPLKQPCGNSPPENKGETAERTGPLQHKEIQALKKVRTGLFVCGVDCSN